MELFLIILTYLVAKLFSKPVFQLLKENKAVKKNYLGQEIPTAMGLLLWLGMLPAFLIYYVAQTDLVAKYILILTVTIFVGFIDDLLGNHQVKGIRGHLIKLFKERKLTSGGLKALVISSTSLFFTYNLSNLLLWTLNFGILILTTNSFNLLDLRPGRAIKFYFIFAIPIIVVYPATRLFLGIILASIIPYAHLDFKGKAMLGDAGSNFLGMSLGIIFIESFSLTSKFMLLLFLVLLHIYTERRSLSLLFEKITLLRILDNLGRG